MQEAQKDSPSSVDRYFVRQVLLSEGPAHHACHVQKQKIDVIFKAYKAEACKSVGDPIPNQSIPCYRVMTMVEIDYRNSSESIIVQSVYN